MCEVVLDLDVPNSDFYEVSVEGYEPRVLNRELVEGSGIDRCFRPPLPAPVP
jgi:hypothetical protein